MLEWEGVGRELDVMEISLSRSLSLILIQKTKEGVIVTRTYQLAVKKYIYLYKRSCLVTHSARSG